MNWNHLENLTLNLTFGLLFIVMLLYWVSLSFPSIQYLSQIGTIGIIVSCVCLSFILSSRWIINQYFPLSNLYESLLFLAWCITFIHIVVEYKTNSRLIGAVNTPIAMSIIAFSSFFLPTDMQQSIPLVPALKSNWLMMHVSVMLLSYAALIVGSLLSILFLILTYNINVELQGSSTGTVLYKSLNTLNVQDVELIRDTSQISVLSPSSGLKKNHTQVIGTNNKRLSLLESIDNLSYRIIGLGFPLLTIGIIAGAVWANEAWGSYWSWDPKETWALITWLVFAAYLHARLNQAWQSKKPAILASIGFFIVWICYLGVNFLGKGLHNYGWIL